VTEENAPLTKADVRNPIIYLFSKTWIYSAGNRKNVIVYWCMFIAANATRMLIAPMVMAKLMSLVAGGVTIQILPMAIGLLALRPAATFLFWMFHGPARVIECCNAFKARASYRIHLLKGVMSLPMGWHADHHSGDAIDKIEKGTNALQSFSEQSFEIIEMVARLVISFCVLAYFSRTSAAIAFSMLTLSVWITMRFDKILIGQYRELNRNENRVAESTFNAISNITTVIILRVERLVFEAIVRKIQKPYKLFKNNSTLNEIKWFLTSMSCSAMFALVIGAYLWQHADAKPGTLIASVYLLINYADEIGEVFYRFTSKYADIVRQKSRVLNAEELAADFKPNNFANHVLPLGWRTIQVDNLRFSYDDNGGTELHLSDISLSLSRGERIAFVGESGSGKTTLLRLMRGLYNPSNLELSVDGVPVAEGFDGICRDIALVPQNPELFATTVLENITLGADYDMAAVRRYTDMACVTDVIDKLPRGFDSSINEKGVNLSGGQQQRLALSRGLLACDGKSIVLLDEPTSSVDPANEIRIHQNIFRQFKDKTVISSVHRLYLLPLFDRIIMIENGQIIGNGTLEYMLATCSQFKELWDKCSKQRYELAS